MNKIILYILIIVVILVIISVIEVYQYKNIDKHIENYHNYKFKIGDIVLINSEGPLSYMVSLFARSKYSHCGIIVDVEKRLIAHSHILNTSSKDKTQKILIQNEIKNEGYINKNSGVIIESLDTMIKKKEIKNMLILPINVDIDYNDMFKAYVQFMNKPYKKSIIELINVNNNLFKNRRNNKSLFCSEFIIEILQSLDVIDKNIVSNTIIPDKLLLLKSHNKDNTLKILLYKQDISLLNFLIYQFLLFIHLPINIYNELVSSL
jgi:hypothetical protein